MLGYMVILIDTTYSRVLLYVATYYGNNSIDVNAVLLYHLLNSVNLIVFYGIPDARALPLYSNRGIHSCMLTIK